MGSPASGKVCAAVGDLLWRGEDGRVLRLRRAAAEANGQKQYG